MTTLCVVKQVFIILSHTNHYRNSNKLPFKDTNLPEPKSMHFQIYCVKLIFDSFATFYYSLKCLQLNVAIGWYHKLTLNPKNLENPCQTEEPPHSTSISRQNFRTGSQPFGKSRPQFWGAAVNTLFLLGK